MMDLEPILGTLHTRQGDHHTLVANLLFGSGRKPEKSEETHTNSEKMQNSATVRHRHYLLHYHGAGDGNSVVCMNTHQSPACK